MFFQQNMKGEGNLKLSALEKKTPLKCNCLPLKKGSSQKENSSSNHHFSGRELLIFRGVNTSWRFQPISKILVKLDHWIKFSG